MAATSGWYALNTGCKQLQEVLENPETRVLDTAFREQLGQIDVDNLSGISLHEAANALDCLWRERPDLRPDLASRLWSILPPEERWAEKKENITGLQFVFTLARSPLATPSDAQRLIEAGRNRRLISVYEKLDTLPLFLYLWNLAALWYECGPNPPNPLGDLLPSDTRDLLITGLDKRARKWFSDEEPLNLLALAGLLSYLMSERLKGIQNTLRRLNLGPGPHWFRQAVAEQTFVLAFFAVKGLPLLWPMPASYTSLICARLLISAQGYEDQGPAIGFLCDEVRRYKQGDGGRRCGPHR